MKPIPKTMLFGHDWHYTNRTRLAKQLRHFRKLNKVTREYPHAYIVDLRKPEWNEEDGGAFIWLVITKEKKND